MPSILMESPKGDYSYLATLKAGCEKLVNETQADLRQFQEEQNSFRHKIHEIIQENTQLNLKLDSHLERLSTTSLRETQSDETSENLARQAILTLKQQVETLKLENEELKAFNQTTKTTMENLEKEIQTYREQLYPNREVKKKNSDDYKMVIHTLDGAIRAHKADSEKQLATINMLMDDKAKLSAKVNLLEDQLKDVSEQLVDATSKIIFVDELKDQLKESNWQCEELEKSLRLCRKKLDISQARENTALIKVDESIAIADAAQAEKLAVAQKAAIAKDEHDAMAAIIGQVMQEAAQQADNNMEVMRQSYEAKLKLQSNQMKKLLKDIQTQQEIIEKLQGRCDTYKEVVHENRRIVAHLKDLEEKLKKSESMVEEYKRLNRLGEDNEQELQKFINHNKELIQKYKDTSEENTKKFQEQLYRMQHENATLKTELQILRIKFGCVGNNR